MEVLRRISASSNSQSYDKEGNPTSSSQRSQVFSIISTRPSQPVINKPNSNGYRRPSPWSNGSYAVELGSNLPRFYATKGVVSGMNGTGGAYTYYSGTCIASSTTSIRPAEPSLDELRMKVLNNLRSEKLDVAMALAELNQSVGTLGSLLGRVARSMDSVKRRKPVSFHYLLHGRTPNGKRPTDQFLNDTAGVFMEWKYGIMPTVNDISAIVRELDPDTATEESYTKEHYLVARASVQRTSSGKLKCSCNVAQGNNSSGSQTVERPWTATVERRARADFRVSRNTLRGLNRYGIGLSSLPTVVWDKTPFTFVLNMALPISDLIKAWSALEGVSVLGYTETTHTRVQFKEAHSTWKGWADSPGSRLITVPGSTEMWFSRTGSSSIPMPVPFIRNPVSTGNLSTALALFTQLRSSKGLKTN